MIAAHKLSVLTGLGFVVVALGVSLFVVDLQEEIDERAESIAELKADRDRMQREADQYDRLVEELEIITVNTRTYVRMLPAPEIATEERLLEVVGEECDRAQIRIEKVIQRAKPVARKSHSPAREIVVTLQLAGTYDGFIRLVNYLERKKDLLIVRAFQVHRPGSLVDPPGKLPLRITLEVSTWRYQVS